MELSIIPYTAIGIGLALAILLYQRLRRTRGGTGVAKRANRNVAWGTSIEYACAMCSGRFSRVGRWSPDNPALGGARCRSCGTFFCDKCANRVVPLGTKGKKLLCTCGASFLTRGVDNEWVFDNFVEMVVFRVH